MHNERAPASEAQRESTYHESQREILLVEIKRPSYETGNMRLNGTGKMKMTGFARSNSCRRHCRRHA
jgi:hypothetical protein